MAKFLRRGKAAVEFVPTIAGTGAPTAVERSSGTNLSPRLADISGWMVETSRIDTPDLASRYVSNIPGEESTPDSSLTIYADDAASDAIKTALARDTAGYIMISHKGVGTGLPADVFPIRVASVSQEYSMGNDAARYVISFAITAVPRIDVAQA